MQYATLNSYNNRMLRVLIHIEANLAGDLDLHTLAKIANYSPFHFHEVFCSVIGVTPGKYCLQRRMALAGVLLRKSSQPVGEIAFSCGYKDATSFSRAFRKENGSPPRKYRSMVSERKNPSMAAVKPARIQYMQEAPHDQVGILSGVVETIPEIYVAYMESNENCETSQKGFSRLVEMLDGEGAFQVSPLRLSLYFMDQKTHSMLDDKYECCVLINKSLPSDQTMMVKHVNGGLFAGVTILKETDLDQAYSWLQNDFLPQNNLTQRDGPVWKTSLEHHKGSKAAHPYWNVMVPVVR